MLAIIGMFSFRCWIAVKCAEKKLERAVSSGEGRGRKTRRGKEEQKQKSTKTDLDRKKGSEEEKEGGGRERECSRQKRLLCARQPLLRERRDWDQLMS